ncbi:MAG: hypothetical protein MN733_37710, partial [Nitrososphaera sp.]|nr:hypothetical protein [Nitrososphaera sp.]
KDVFKGGSFGGQLHEGELRRVFNLPKSEGGKVLDYRSYNDGSPAALGDKSMQVTVLFDKNDQIIGAYIDADQYNFRQDGVGAVGHGASLVAHLFKKYVLNKECP